MLPKVELHLHLEGAAPPAFIRDLAKQKHMDLAGIFDAEGGYSFTDFWNFLKVYEAACTTLQSIDRFADPKASQRRLQLVAEITQDVQKAALFAVRASQQIVDLVDHDHPQPKVAKKAHNANLQ